MAKIKILHFSDLHNGYEQLKALMKYATGKKDIDLITCSGDIIGQCINGEQAQQAYVDLETMINDSNTEIKPAKDLEDAIKICSKSSNIKIREAAVRYKSLENKFDETSLGHYKQIFEELNKTKKPFTTVGGNWDNPKTYFEVFRDVSIQNRIGELNGLKVAGYGGSDYVPKLMPPSRFMPYDDAKFGKFLNEIKADILISHMPPKGLLGGKDNVGSQALSDYINKYHPKLVLCGHSHKCGYKKINGTTIVNPGNLGKYYNQKHYGTFAEIEIEIDGDKVLVTHYQINKDGTVAKLDIKES